MVAAARGLTGSDAEQPTKWCVENASDAIHSLRMSAYRIVAAALMLACVLALILAPVSVRAGEGMTLMPCHSEDTPTSDHAKNTQPPCCLPMCCATMVAVAPSLIRAQAWSACPFVAATFVSKTDRPRVPPPRT